MVDERVSRKLPRFCAVGVRDPDVPVLSGTTRIDDLPIRCPCHSVRKIGFEYLSPATLIFIRSRDPDAARVHLLDRSDRTRVCREPDADFAITIQVIRDTSRRAAGVGK